jgi:two-component system OmpR family response regulator
MTSILVADSDKMTRELLSIRLKDRGYEVFVAQDGMQGMSMYEEINPRLVITDLMLPVMNGYQMIRGIKNREKQKGHERCKIIVLAGKRNKYDIDRCFELGAADYVPKPFSPVELEARILRQLAE